MDRRVIALEDSRRIDEHSRPNRWSENRQVRYFDEPNDLFERTTGAARYGIKLELSPLIVLYVMCHRQNIRIDQFGFGRMDVVDHVITIDRNEQKEDYWQ